MVTATNKNLEEMVREGTFREDLYYRLNVLPIRLPPLRERKEDVPLLVERFVQELEREGATEGRCRVAPDTLELLVAYRWPGNVRELQNEVRRAAILADGVILPDHLSERVRRPGDDGEDGPSPAERGTTLPDLVRELEEREIRRALRQSQGNKSRTAELLGLSRFALQRKLEKYGIEVAEVAGDEAAS